MENTKNRLKSFLKSIKRIIIFHLVLNIVFALFISASSYYHIPLNTFEGRLMYFMHLSIVQTTFAGVLYLISLSRILFKVAFSLLFLILGFIGFWTYSINISVSYALIDAVLDTKLYIVKDLISIQLVLFSVCLFGVLFFIFKLYKRIQPTKGIFVFLPLSLILFSLFFVADNLRHHSFRSKLPYVLFYSIGEFINTNDLPLKETLPKVTSSQKEKLKVVLVLGESLRADHLGLNGYDRQTTPKLASKKNIVSFINMYTNKTNTVLSVPCILTDRSIYSNNEDSIRSIYSVYNSLQIPTKWIGNQLLESSYKGIVETNEEVKIIDEFKSYWNTSKKQDLHLIPEFKDRISATNQGLYTLHMIGSHWWYEDKYTDEYRRYKPVVDSKYIPSLEKEQIINSYDNTILYLDNFLDTVINVLEKQEEPSIMIFIADHGESLGEDGKWLHSHSDGLTNPGMIIWYSNSFEKSFPEKVKFIHANKNSRFTTDIIFNSLLDLIEVEGLNYKKSESVFRVSLK